MKIKKHIASIKRTMLIFMVVVAGTFTASAVNWYDDMQPDLGQIKVHELASWMVKGNIDYTTIYIAPKVTKIELINGLVCITEDGAIAQELEKLPAYKKWVVITPDGDVSDETSKLLASSKANTVLVLEGGRSGWESQIQAASIAGLNLSEEDRTALNNVRPFFRKSTVERASQPMVVKAVAAEASFEEDPEEEEDEEEGC